MTNTNVYTISKTENKKSTYYTIEGNRHDKKNNINYDVAGNIKELIKLMRLARVVNPLATFTLSDSLTPAEMATITTDAPKLFTAPKLPQSKNLSQDPAAVLKYMRKIAKSNDQPQLKCIYFDPERQMAVATDAMRLIASRAVFDQYPQFAGCMVDFEAAKSYPCDGSRSSEIGRYPNWPAAIPADPGQPLSLFPQPVPVNMTTYECAIGTNQPDGLPVCCNAKWYHEIAPLFPAAPCNSLPHRAIVSQNEDLIVLLMPMFASDGLTEYLATLATDTTSQGTPTDTTSQDTTPAGTTDTTALLAAGLESGHVIICHTPTSQKTARAIACSTPRAVTPMPSSQKTDNPATASQPLSIDRLKEIRKTVFDGKTMNRLVEFEDKTKDGETVGMEIMYSYEDQPTTNSLVTLWHKSGYTKEVLNSYICIRTYATLDNGMCYGYYNPQEKPSADGKRREINFDYMFQISEENEKKLIQAVADMANKGQKHITR